jgi:hypothetical protein
MVKTIAHARYMIPVASVMLKILGAAPGLSDIEDIDCDVEKAF